MNQASKNQQVKGNQATTMKPRKKWDGCMQKNDVVVKMDG
jgi:hypothetical protein